MLKRHEAAALVDNMLADTSGAAKADGDCWHFGKQELRTLMDAIYGGPPQADAEVIGWKYRGRVPLDENGDPDRVALLCVQVVEWAAELGFHATARPAGQAVVATIINDAGKTTDVLVEQSFSWKTVADMLKAARRGEASA